MTGIAAVWQAAWAMLAMVVVCLDTGIEQSTGSVRWPRQVPPRRMCIVAGNCEAVRLLMSDSTNHGASGQVRGGRS